MNARPLCGVVLGVVLALAAAPSLVCAAERGPVEVGFSLASLSVMKADSVYYGYGYSSDTMWLFSAPGTSFSGLLEPGLHATFGVGSKVSLEPQLGIVHYRQNSDSATILNVATQVNVSLRPWESKTTYLFGRAGLMATLGDGSDTTGMLGLGVGYRVPIREYAVIRCEAFYNRYLDSDTNQLGVRVKLGILF
jgi:hypothetical protein